LARRTLPTEEEQVGIYRKLLSLLEGRPVSIRTFDLRPDKLMTYSHMTSSAAKPFDWRLVMESDALQQLFREQVRAILRAAEGGRVRHRPRGADRGEPVRSAASGAAAAD